MFVDWWQENIFFIIEQCKYMYKLKIWEILALAKILIIHIMGYEQNMILIRRLKKKMQATKCIISNILQIIIWLIKVKRSKVLSSSSSLIEIENIVSVSMGKCLFLGGGCCWGIPFLLDKFTKYWINILCAILVLPVILYALILPFYCLLLIFTMHYFLTLYFYVILF